MKLDILPLMLLASALSTSGGAWIGYKMSVAVRAALHEAPKAIPIEAAVPTGEVGVLTLRPTVVHGWTRPRAASVLPFVLPTSDEPKFFDFRHSYCDEAESVHGKVLRCTKSPR